MPDTPKTKYLKDYTPFSYAIDAIDLHFSLNEDVTRVRSRLAVRRKTERASVDLVLDGSDLELLTLELDSSPLPENQYTLTRESLTIHAAPHRNGSFWFR